MTLTSVSVGKLAISSRMLAFKSSFTTEGNETSIVEPIDWMTEKPLTKGSETSSLKPVDCGTEKSLTKYSETSSVEPVLYVRWVPAQSPACKDGNEGHRGKSKGRGSFCAERRGDSKIEALYVSRWSGRPRYSSSSSCRPPGLPDKVTGSLGSTLKLFRKVRWVTITDSRFEK